MSDTQPTLPRSVRKRILDEAATHRPLWREPMFLAALGCVALALTVVVLWVQATVGNAKAAQRANAAGLAQANDRLLSLGAPPVSTPAPVTVPTITRTVTESPAVPSQGQVDLAVHAYCSSNSCGSVPTAAQVAQAVATYCSVDGRCKGAAGAHGSSGAAGQPGTAGQPGASGSNGADGENATPDQVSAAVATYCEAHDSCRGTTGATGPEGAQGPAGPKGDPGDPCPATITVTPGPLDQPSTPYTVCVPSQ